VTGVGLRADRGRATTESGSTDRALSEACDVNPRGWLPANLPDDTEVTFVPMAAVSEIAASIEAPEVRRLGDVRKGYTAFAENDVLLAKITPCMENGKVAFATGLRNGIGFGSTEFHVLRARSSNEPKFLYHLVRQPKFRAAAKQSMRGGVGQQRVPEDFVERYRVRIPPLSEQRRIVEILDQADSLRQLRTAADAKAGRILPALFYKMFGDPAANPMGWPVVSMYELFAMPPNYGTMIPPTSDASGWLDLRVINIQDRRLDLTNRKYVDLAAGDRARHEVRDGDLLLARAIGSRNHLGKCIVAHPGTERWAFDSHLMRVRFNPKRVRPEFVQAFLNSPSGRREFLSRTRNSAVQFNINTGELGAIRLPLPPLELQQRFVDHASRLIELETMRQKSCAAIDCTFQTLLHLAFSGDLTAKWRQVHMRELLAEMEHQAKALTQSSVAPEREGVESTR
jgi:type I restriction enzyme S subunit